MNFNLKSDFKPKGDQLSAIKKLNYGINNKEKAQVLLGVTGSGKTFTMANVISEQNKPTLILCHNKTLAAQLYGELKQFFPDNAVEYFISYYDYYQPEAYIPTTNVYIEKDLSINQEIEKLRLSASSSLLSGRNDVIVVASVSCIYGIGNPDDFGKNVIKLKIGDTYNLKELLFLFVDILYERSYEEEFKRGSFRLKGDTLDIFVAYDDFIYRIIFWGKEIESIQKIDPASGRKISDQESIIIYPANLFVTSKDVIDIALTEIEKDLDKQVNFFEKEGKFFEAKRIKERTEFDLEMINEIGYCSGIENYSRYFDRRNPGKRPFCLLDYFPDNFLMFIDESHVTIPQVRAMWGGDRSRKMNLVEYGFRLPSALDNRPLNFQEFESMINQVIFVGATPSEYELTSSGGSIVEQIIRPTGLLDPKIEVRKSENQIDDILNEINLRVDKDERILITTLTKRMSEELSKYLLNSGVACRYMHSEIDTLERVNILRGLRLGDFNVLVGVNLLREGLDLPEVSLVIILDADKEGFLRNEKSLIQTSGRAARNVNGLVIMYADKITKSMDSTIKKTQRRRKLQNEYNIKNNIIPKTISKSKEYIIAQTTVGKKLSEENKFISKLEIDPVIKSMSKEEIDKIILRNEKQMNTVAKNLDFFEAARLRDENIELKKIIESKLDFR
ncbi:MAG: excinuclease ABC subunit UvrB [Bacteroidota bacterium]|nr:excinuclease ABC subunit UvrB [Bacteroidota bacterium]